MVGTTVAANSYHLPSFAGLLFTLLQLTNVAQVATLDLDVGENFAIQPGQDATLSCNYTTTLSASEGRLSWSFINGSSDVTFYQYRGTTGVVPSTAPAGYQGRITFLGNLTNGIADIQLSNMQLGDTGDYKCLVNVVGDATGFKFITVTVREPTTLPPPTTVGPETTAKSPAGDNTATVLAIVIPTVVGVVIVVAAGAFIWCICLRKKGLMRLELHILPDLKLDVHWTAPRGYEGASYQVVYIPEGSNQPIFGPEVSADNPPNYKYKVTFPGKGKYELYVLVKNGQTEKKSDIEEIAIEDTARPNQIR